MIKHNSPAVHCGRISRRHQRLARTQSGSTNSNFVGTAYALFHAFTVRGLAAGWVRRSSPRSDFLYDAGLSFFLPLPWPILPRRKWACFPLLYSEPPRFLFPSRGAVQFMLFGKGPVFLHRVFPGFLSTDFLIVFQGFFKFRGSSFDGAGTSGLTWVPGSRVSH